LNKLGLGISATTLKTKDFNKIMGEVTKTVNGFAKKEANTAEGKMRRLKVATNELKESFGYMLLPYLEKGADIFAKMIPFVERNKDTIGKFIVVIGGLALAVIGVNGALKVFEALQTVKMFAGMIARWAGYTVAVEATGTAATTTGGEIAAAGAVADVAWAPFLLTIGAIAAAFVGIKLVTDKLIANRKALLTDPSKIPSWSTESSKTWNGTSMSNAPKHAAGGIVTRPQIGIIGEAGPEAIIPLNKAGMFGGITIINHIQGSVVTEKEIAVRVRNDMAQLLRRKGLSTAILGV
jgi:hypothetical protein